MATITIVQGSWTYMRQSRWRDLLWNVPMVVIGCGVC